MKFCTLLISLTLTLLAGLSTPVFADDTEIYVRKVEAVDESTRPNMLFVLDNSGSMNESLRKADGTPTGERRIDVLKEALVRMLDNTNNVNVGLARFASLIKNNDPKDPHVNVPIMFPVTYIDGNVNELDGEIDDSIMDASMSIAQSSDDAVQNLGSGQMILNDPELKMVHIITEEEPNGIKVAQEIQHQADDAVEFIEDSNKVRPWDTPVIYLGTDPVKGETLVGLRFKELGIPKGATIEYAEIEFMSDEIYDTDLQIVISGADNDGIAPVTGTSPPIAGDASGARFGDSKFKNGTSTNGYLSGEDYPQDGKNFPPTNTSVSWKPDKIEAVGQRFKTNNIGGIIQEIVKRDGWHDYNGLVLLLKKASSSSAEARRGFYTRDSSEDPPKLRVYWTLPETERTVISGWDNQSQSVVHQNQLVETENTQIIFNDQRIRLGKQLKGTSYGNGDETLVGIRFEAVPLPQGAKIIEANITFTHQSGPEPAAGSELLNLLVYGDKSPDAVKLNKNITGGKVSERKKTKTFVTWDGVAETDVGDDPLLGKPFTLADPLLAAILQEITDQPDWKSGNDMAFLFERNGEPVSPNTGFRRIVGSRDIYRNSNNSLITVDQAEIEPNENTLPRLQVKFSVGLPEETEIKNPDMDKQIVGLRFEAVDIPQGAKVTSAAIQFVSGPDASGHANLIIKAEKTANAKTFTEENNNISNRPTTGERVTWDNIEAWTEGVTYSTPDLKSVVQELVNQTDWCGGVGGLVFIISTDSGNPLRNVKSYDDRPGYAPVLKVEFDSKAITGNGCVHQNFIGQIAAENDDAEQKMSGGEAGDIYLASDALEFPARGNEARLVGLRFNDIPIGKNATIIKAQLILTARNDGDKDTLTKISGEKSGNAKVFTNNKFDLGQRTQTTTVPWAPGPWERNKLYRSADISPIIQEIINEPDWEIYNSMAFFLSVGHGQRDISAFRAGPTSSAKLLIQVKGYLGESGQGDLMTVRRRLKKIVKKMEIPPSTTPIVNALYESALYFRSGRVDYGKDRHNQAQYLVSHPATYSGGQIERDFDNCKINVKPLHENCASEKITGPATYKSPIKSSCQTNHIVFLSDGIATQNTAEDKVKQMVGLNNCVKEYPDPDDPENGESIDVPYRGKCGIELADFLYNQDHLNKRENTENTENNITVHTIGFQLGNAWRVKYVDQEGNRVYKKDGIPYYENGGEVPEDKLPILKDGYEEDTNGTKNNLKAVKYLKRLASVSKSGDKKRNFYPADTADDLSKAFDEITAQAMTSSSSFAAPGVSINNFNSLEHNDQVFYALFEPSPYRYWNGNVKKFRLSENGLVLDKSDNVALENNHIKDGARDFWDESSSTSKDEGGTVLKGGVGSQLISLGSAGRQIYTYLGDTSPGYNHEVNLAQYPIEVASGDEEFDKALTQALLGDDMPVDEAEAEGARHYLIKWIKGEDVSLVEGVASSGANERWMFGDPLHSTPKMITYGGDEHNQKNKLFVGTNDGLLRMFNTDSGQEEWAFLPQELLPIQKLLMENPLGVDRIYGLDNTPTFWINDGNDNQINPGAGDFVKMFMTMRRGGRNLYALDVTGTEDSLGAPPKLMWVIKGGEGDYEKLGQTWSSPRPTVVDPSYCHVINAHAQGCVVLLFGGGYNSTQDEGVSKISTEASRMGNAIYMVHAETGQLLWWASSAEEADLTLEYMIYSIPSAVTMLASDDNTDLIYVGDIGGQLWRIELLGRGKTRGGRLAVVSETQTFDVGNTNRRSFFYPPAVTEIKGKLLIATMSGTRPHPLYGGNDVRDQFYVFLDQKWDEDKDKLRTLKPKTDMVDVTAWSEGSQVNLMEFKSDDDKQGWYFNLADGGSGSALSWIGEKGITAPVIVEEKVIFTTYVPSLGDNDACHFNEGQSRLYILFLLSGGPAYDVSEEKFDTDTEGGDESSDRFIESGSGPGGGPVIIRSPGGKDEKKSTEQFILDGPSLGFPPVKKTFWMQKEGCGL